MIFPVTQVGLFCPACLAFPSVLPSCPLWPPPWSHCISWSWLMSSSRPRWASAVTTARSACRTSRQATSSSPCSCCSAWPSLDLLPPWVPHTSVMPAQLWCAECQRWDRREMHPEKKKKKIMDGCCMENFISELRKPFSVFDSKPHTMTMAACMNGIERNKHGAWTNYTSSYFSSLTETPKLNKTKFMFLFSVDPFLHLRM